MRSTVSMRRGQPLMFVGLLLLGWAGLRTALWENPFPVQLTGDVSQLLATASEVGIADRPRSASATYISPVNQQLPTVQLPDQLQAPPVALNVDGLEAVPLASKEPPFAEGRSEVAHNLLWMAASAYLPLPTSVARLLDQQTSAAPQQGRWQMDGWLMLRSGDQPSTGPGERPSSYGSSQAGAVLTFRLAPSSPHRPAAYARASQALVTGGESELALGVRARPLLQLPLDLHAEMRATRRLGDTEFRPSVFATAGVEREGLPLGFQAHAYGQAGWVGGKYATPFVDGQIAAVREVAEFDLAQVSAGVGAWGGAQRGAERLDVGPTASVKVELGEVPMRLSADYRIRVAGDAAPGSGVAVTLISGF